MDRTTRIAVWPIVGGTVVSGVIAVWLTSWLWTLVTVVCAIVVAVLVVLSLAGGRRHANPPVTLPRGYAPTSSSTIGVVESERPVVFESSDVHVQELASTDTPPMSGPESAEIEDVERPSAPMPFIPEPPASSGPHEIIESLLISSRAAGKPVAAHLWLEDAVTETLRLVEAQGEPRPEPVPISRLGGLLGEALMEGTDRMGAIEAVSAGAAPVLRWRYALPLTGSEIRGVAAVDFEGETEPDLTILAGISATLRASLSGALALHVARIESQSARALVDVCGRLAGVLEPGVVLDIALDSAMSLTGAQTGSIMLFDPTNHRMHIAASRGLPDEIVSSTDVPQGDGIAGWVAAREQSLVIEDLNNGGARSHRHGVRSAVCVPLADDQGAIGVLNVGCDAFQARYYHSHVLSLEALGRSVVVALRNAWRADGAKDRYFETLEVLSRAFEARDPFARGGVERIARLVGVVGAKFGLSTEEMTALRIAALLHDVGMSSAGAVPPNTDGPLSTVEWGMLKMHPVIAAEFMSDEPALASVIPLVYHHHEHFDGTGYVDGLAGSAIPLGSRILAAVDAYVAMTSDRPYRTAFTHARAVEELQSLAGSQFDPAVVEALVDALAADEFKASSSN